MKSKTVAYLLWFFFGLFGIHKFYLHKVGLGILYLLTLGIFGIGWLIDLFTLSTQVEVYNLKKNDKTNVNINVNTFSNEGKNQNSVEQLYKLAELKEKGLLTEEEFSKQKSKILD